LTRDSDRDALAEYERERSVRITAGQQLYAQIKRSSKYYGQTDAGAIFPVHILIGAGDYVVQGWPGGQYRLCDVHILVADEHGKTMRISGTPQSR
jgi:hypothetical protein